MLTEHDMLEMMMMITSLSAYRLSRDCRIGGPDLGLAFAAGDRPKSNTE